VIPERIIFVSRGISVVVPDVPLLYFISLLLGLFTAVIYINFYFTFAIT